jgi:hypothetical protein
MAAGAGAAVDIGWADPLSPSELGAGGEGACGGGFSRRRRRRCCRPQLVLEEEDPRRRPQLVLEEEEDAIGGEADVRCVFRAGPRAMRVGLRG